MKAMHVFMNILTFLLETKLAENLQAQVVGLLLDEVNDDLKKRNV